MTTARPNTGTVTRPNTGTVAQVLIAAAALALDQCTSRGSHDLSQLHVELVQVAESVTRRLPQLAPDDWQHTR